MAKILRLSDRVKLKIKDITFYLSPISNDKKIEISSCTKLQAGEVVFDHAKAQHLYIKYSLKDIEGVETYDGEAYKLEFEGDTLTDECVSEIFNLEQKNDLMSCAWQMLNGIPEKFVDDNGKKMQGVALDIISKKDKSG